MLCFKFNEILRFGKFIIIFEILKIVNIFENYSKVGARNGNWGQNFAKINSSEKLFIQK